MFYEELIQNIFGVWVVHGVFILYAFKTIKKHNIIKY